MDAPGLGGLNWAVIIIYLLATLAISSVTDISPVLIAAVVGVLSVIYTFLGGMEGVIWSDVAQAIILLVGAAVILIFGIAAIDGGLTTVAADAASDGKFITADNWTIGGAAAAIPIIFLGSVFNNLHQYTASQDVVQRYQTTDSPKSTAKSLMVNRFLALLTIPLFYGIGTVLYSYYRHADALPADFNTSAIVPYFAVKVLPAGISGLLIAAIFAAAQSTISSSLNSISACVTVDIRDRFFPPRGGKPRSGVGFSRFVIIAVGIASVAVALYLVATDQAETWDLFLSITGLFGVPLAGVFAWGSSRNGPTPSECCVACYSGLGSPGTSRTSSASTRSRSRSLRSWRRWSLGTYSRCRQGPSQFTRIATYCR